MRAVLVKQFGDIDQIAVEEIESPVTHAGEVKIRVRACGINFPDVLMVKGLYQVKPALPFSPGLEVAGDVIEVGEGVTHLRVGDRIIAAIMYGGFAEEVTVPAEIAMPMPDTMSYEHGAVSPIVYGTSHIALNYRGKLKAGETLLVLGAAGGVGLTAVELGKLMGATVIAAASSEEKLALTREYGADHTINYLEEDLRDAVKKITNGQYADVVYDPVGGSAFDAAIRCLAQEGRYLVIGFASGKIPEVAVNRLLLKNSAIVGVYWGGLLASNPTVVQGAAQEILQWYSEGKVKPHVDRSFSLEQAASALHMLENREAKGKLVITP